MHVPTYAISADLSRADCGWVLVAAQEQGGDIDVVVNAARSGTRMLRRWAEHARGRPAPPFAATVLPHAHVLLEHGSLARVRNHAMPRANPNLGLTAVTGIPDRRMCKWL
jgi:hypothetical protein